MVNPGAFQGLRKEFLMGEKEAYAVAMKEGYVGDIVASICCRYLKRFPIDLDHKEDPTAEFLAAVDNNAMDVEPTEPDAAAMSPEEYEAAIKKQQEHSKLLLFHQAQIKRWLAYQYNKDNHDNAKEAGCYNLYSIMIHQLTGKSSTYPRAHSAANVWRKFQRNAIEKQLKVATVIALHAGKPILKEHYVAERDKIAREMFLQLPFHVQNHWKDQATLEHREAIRQYEREISEEPSSDPVDRQRAIQRLTKFIQPVLDLVCKATGWKATLIAGSPEPAHNGRLNVISIHSGTTSGDIKMNFGRSEHAAYKNSVIPVFGNFLQKCYSPEECRSRALPVDMGYIPMCNLETSDDNFSIHPVPDCPNFEAETTAISGQPPHLPTTTSQHNAVGPSDNVTSTSSTIANTDVGPGSLVLGGAVAPHLGLGTNVQAISTSPPPSPPISCSATPLPTSPLVETEQDIDNPYPAFFAIPDTPITALVPAIAPTEATLAPLPPLSLLATSHMSTGPPRVVRKRTAAPVPEAPAAALPLVSAVPPSLKRKANAGAVPPSLKRKANAGAAAPVADPAPKRVRTRSATKAIEAEAVQTATGKKKARGKKTTKVDENVRQQAGTAKRPVRNRKVVRR